MSVWFFEPPTSVESFQPWEQAESQGGRWSNRWSMFFWRMPRGLAVWQDAGGVWYSQRFPGITDINAAQWAYLGGHTSVVSDVNKAAIIAAGLGIDSTYFVEAPAGTPLTPPPVGDTNGTIPPPYSG